MRNNSGFTLIELMIVIVIVGFLMAYALPTYNRQVIVSKRSEAHAVLLRIAARQEKNNVTFLQYASTIDASTTATAADLGYQGVAFTSSPDYQYTMNNDNGYTITATAVGPTQVNDNYQGDDCRILTLDSLGRRTPLNCWQ